MAKVVVKRAEARRDLVDHYVFIGRRSLRAADRFLAAAEADFRTLADMPFLGGLWEGRNPTFADMRTWPIRRFKNYVIYYRPISNGIEVIRVLHAAQDTESIFEGSD